ncbi:MAG: hypothetical protein H6716_28300 [Polyangiaceae bacterium]|nr:hypothetical protein [Polyangiaceae bacterium]
MLIRRIPKMNAAATEGGGGGAADAGAENKASGEQKTEAKADAKVDAGADKKQAPATESKAEGEQKAETKIEVKVDAAEKKVDGPDLASILAELEAGKKKTAELEEALQRSNTEARDIAFEAAFDRAGVLPDQVDDEGKPKGPLYRAFLKSQLGDVDPRTEAGKAAIDMLVKLNPAMTSGYQSTEDPMGAFLKAKAEEARKANQPSMWGLIPPDMMRGYGVDNLKGGE